MPGPYDNESARYIEDEGFEKGHWYQDMAGALYIVPDDTYGIREIEGPDGETLNALNRTYRGKAFGTVNQIKIAKLLRLEIIQDVLKRFSAESGYYSA